MSCLEATFTLTPKSPGYSDALHNRALIYCHGADFQTGFGTVVDFSSLYASNRFYFAGSFAANPDLDYTQWANLKTARHLFCYIELPSFAAAQKQLALIFGFDVPSAVGRVLIYSNAGLVKDQPLAYGDNQFLLEIESLDLPIRLYFIHAGGSWFFRGLSGYVV